MNAWHERNRDRLQRDAEKAMDQSGRSLRGLSPSKRYKGDPSFSRTPVAICDNCTIGLPTCKKGEGKYCYSTEPCESQMRIEDPTVRIPQAEALWQQKQHEAIRHAREKASRMTPHEDEALEMMSQMMINMARAAKEEQEKERKK